ncbi:iron-siderophore ABC transporter substrate-binding protein [Haloechinothrix sp. LS1_15]|uniref:ABC transporter substrate-binding protein n=1 Tax=Haloechinothrix sp. LS1_15 TaxID=2652248 RepID=UPI0029459136|nr:iron-siderophore ABC transporter substrate-binding protein [Haloechinothrix sp. LS1_15]MDV6012744.1 iron-siderophore ABC transporter substrate-binding protein [Haloechinothrix sp. LS1_15]
MDTSRARSSAVLGCAVVLAFTVAGCGAGTADEAGADGEITVNTARGEVALDEQATNVISLEYSATENLLALGVEPVGVADTEGYQEWVSAAGAELPDGVTDVGTRQEPSIESIRALEPDLIVSDDERLAENYDQLSEIAPVLAFDPTADPELETMRTNFTELATAVGREDEAADVLEALEERIAETGERLAEAGAEGATFALAQGFSEEGAPTIRLFTSEAMAAMLLEEAGLHNGWQGDPDEWGMTTVGVESLTQIEDDATFLYVSLPGDDPFAGELSDNAVWQDLPFVAEDRVAALDPGTWLFGGPLSAMMLLDESASAIAD